MRDNVFFVSIVLSLSLSSYADVCSENQCPQGRKPTTICFSDPEAYSLVLGKAVAIANCGYFTDVVITNNITKIKETLQQLAAECKSLDSMTFNGHGNEGQQYAGDLNRDTIKELESFGCLFNKDATIHYTACNVGRGCVGDMFFYQTAKSLLPNGGTVTGPTFYSATVLPGVIPHFSINGRERKLTYSSLAKPPDSWSQTGLAITNGGSINERCLEELETLIGDLKKSKTKANKIGCNSVYNYVDEKLPGYQNIIEHLSHPPPYLQSASSKKWNELADALRSLQSHVRRYESCQPLTNEDSSGGSEPTFFVQ